MRRKAAITSVLTLFSASADPYYQIREEPSHPMAAELVALWREESRTRDPVVGKDIPSRPFARFLSHLMIVEPVEDDTDCKIRIAGDVIRKRYGRDVKDAQFSELFSPAVFRDNMMRLREVRRTGVPIIFDATVIPDDGPSFSYEVVLLRVLSPDERTYWNIVGIFMLDA
ncbi:MAG: PAS domain-containing protein [Alphaproteobacteria bacterium]|nr:PAS domain-containing protein [Alphaproteobacteria bacterium]